MTRWQHVWEASSPVDILQLIPTNPQVTRDKTRQALPIRELAVWVKVLSLLCHV